MRARTGATCAMALLALAGCESARLVTDAGADSGADALALDAGPPPDDAGPVVDLGDERDGDEGDGAIPPDDAGPDTAVRPPRSPGPPSIDWLAEGRPPIVEPLPPDFSDCPPGWRVAEARPGSVPTCEPWPPAGRPECDRSRGLAAFPGGGGCERVGATCPAGGGFPADAPVGAWFVRQGASGAHDGSAANPFATIADALAALTAARRTIVLAAGTYAERLSVPAGVELRGACTESTTVTTSDATVVLVEPLGTGVRLRDLRLVGGSDAIHVGDGADVTLDDVIIEGARTGIRLDGGGLTAHRIVVGAPVAVAGDSETGLGLRLGSNANATVQGAVFVDVPSFGVSLDGSAVLTLEDASVARVGFGISARESARLTLHRVACEDVLGTGVQAFGGPANLDADWLIVRGDPRPAASWFGLEVALGSPTPTATVHHALIERARYVGVRANGSVTLEDSVIRDGTPEGVLAFGADFWEGEATLRRVRIEGMRGTGIWTRTRLTLEDVVVTDVERGDEAFVGAGLTVAEPGTSVTATGLRVERATAAGIRITGCGAARGLDLCPGGGGPRVSATGLVVRDTRPDPFGGEPHALHVIGVATLDVTDALLESTAATGLLVEPEATAIVAEGATVSLGTAALVASPPEGSTLPLPALVARSTVTLTLDEVLVSGHRGAVVDLAGEGADLDARDLVIAGAAGSSSTSGIGVLLQGGAQAALSWAEIREAEDVGVIAVGGSSVALTDVRLTGGAAPTSAAMGLFVDDGERVTLDGVAVEGFHAAGLYVAGRGARLDASDVAVAMALDDGTAMAPGLLLVDVPRATLAQVAIRDVAGIGVAAFGPTAYLDATELSVSDVRLPSCAPAACFPVATGVGAFGHATLALTRFLVERADGCGLQVGPDASLTTSAGTVRDSPVGACVYPGFDEAALRASVSFVETPAEVEVADAAEPAVPRPRFDLPR